MVKTNKQTMNRTRRLITKLFILDEKKKKPKTQEKKSKFPKWEICSWQAILMEYSAATENWKLYWWKYLLTWKNILTYVQLGWAKPTVKTAHITVISYTEWDTFDIYFQVNYSPSCLTSMGGEGETWGYDPSKCPPVEVAFDQLLG